MKLSRGSRKGRGSKLVEKVVTRFYQLGTRRGMLLRSGSTWSKRPERSLTQYVVPPDCINRHCWRGNFAPTGAWRGRRAMTWVSDLFRMPMPSSLHLPSPFPSSNLPSYMTHFMHTCTYLRKLPVPTLLFVFTDDPSLSKVGRYKALSGFI